MTRPIEIAIVLGAVGALAYYVWRRAQPTSVPLGELQARVAGLEVTGRALAGAAWLTSDPFGFLTRDPAHLAELEKDAYL